MSTNFCDFLPLEPHLEEQLNDIDEYIRAESVKPARTERWLSCSSARASFSSDRAVPDETPTDFEEAENYLNEQTLHGELLDSLNMLNPPGLDFHVDFWNLKEVYEKKARKTPTGFGYRLGNSAVTIETTTSSELRNLQVYVQRCPEAAIKTHDTVGPIELETTVKQHGPNRTIVTVELDSVYDTDQGDAIYWLEKAEVETRNKWELLVIPQFVNGMKGVIKSKPFRVTSKASARKNRESGSNEKDHSVQQTQQCSLFDGLATQDSSYPSPTSVEEHHLDKSLEMLMQSTCTEEAATRLQLELALLQMNEGPTSPLSPPWEPRPTSPETLCAGRVILKPKSPLDREMVTSRYNRDSRIKYAMEQSDLPGLMKMVSTTCGTAGGRRRANGHKSAEENFWWACGFCFFERRKKSTVKAHVIQRVCRKSARQKEGHGHSSRVHMRRHLSCDTINEPFDVFSWKNSLSV